MRFKTPTSTIRVLRGFLPNHLIIILALYIPLALLGFTTLWGVLLGVWLTGLVFRTQFSNQLVSSRVFREIFIFLIYSLYLQLFVILGWALNHNISLLSIPHIANIFLLITYLSFYILNKKRDISITKLPLFNRRIDLVAILLAIICIGVLVGPSIMSTGPTKKSSIIQIVDGNVDDAAHLSLLNDRLEFDRGVLRNTDVTNISRTTPMYPASWHSMNAIFIKCFAPNITVGTHSLIAFAVTKVFWYFILLLISFYCVFWLLAKVKRANVYDKSIFAAPALLILYFFFAFYVQIFKEGFYSFIPQILYSLLLIPFAALLSSKSDYNKGFSFFIVAFVLIGSCMSWFLTLPGIIIFLLYLISRQYKDHGIQRLLSLIRNSLLYIPSYLVLFLATIIQYYVMSHDTSEGAVSFLQGILLNGGVTVYTTLFQLLVVAGFGITVYYGFKNREAKNYIAIISSFLLGLLVFATFIGLIQTFLKGSFLYYYYKMLYLAYGLMLPFTMVAFSTVLERIRNHYKFGITASLLTVGILLVTIIGIEPVPQKARISATEYLTGTRVSTPTQLETVYQLIRASEKKGVYANNNVVLVFDPNNFEANDIATLLIKSNKRRSGCFNELRKAYQVPEFSALINPARSQVCKGYNISIVTDEANIKAYKQILAKKPTENIRLFSYNQSLEDPGSVVSN